MNLMSRRYHRVDVDFITDVSEIITLSTLRPY